jgi:hypothetical protein
MSLDFHLYTKDERPVTVGELATAAQATGHHLLVLNSFRDWSSYQLAVPDDLISDDAVICLIAIQNPSASAAIDWLTARAGADIQTALEAKLIRTCDLSIHARRPRLARGGRGGRIGRSIRA